MNLWESLCYLFGEEYVKEWMRTSPERYELIIVNQAAISLMGRKKLEQIELEVMERVYVSPQGEPLRAVAVVLTCPSGARGVGTMVCSPTDVFSLKFGLSEARKKAYKDLVGGNDWWLSMDNA